MCLPQPHLSDIASVKRPARVLCRGRAPLCVDPPDVPLTFASLSNLAEENAIVISEGDAGE